MNLNQTNVSNELATAPVGKLLFKLAVPTVIAQFVNLLYNIVDRIYIGHMPGTGSAALTGIGLCFPIIYLISAFSALIGQGGAPRSAIYMGQNQSGFHGWKRIIQIHESDLCDYDTYVTPLSSNM